VHGEILYNPFKFVKHILEVFEKEPAPNLSWVLVSPTDEGWTSVLDMTTFCAFGRFSYPEKKLLTSITLNDILRKKV